MNIERPILFSAPMVRAILEGRKVQTRRIVKMSDGTLADDEDIPAHGECDGLCIPAPDYVMDFSKTFPKWRHRDCPYGKPGDRLWLRETHRFPEWDKIEYRADGTVNHVQDNAEWLRKEDVGQRWKPSIFMPRWASRITLEVMSVRVERLQDISEEDAKAEGCEEITPGFYRNYLSTDGATFYSTAMSFQSLWESINGPDSWDTNPFVWVVEFKRIKP